MATVGMNFTVSRGKEDRFLEIFREIMENIEGASGHTETHLYRDVYSEQDYQMITKWTDETAYGAFFESKAIKSVADWGNNDVLVTPPRYQMYQGDRQTVDETRPAHLAAGDKL